MLVTRAHYRTDHGSRYLQQLCKHFAHKTEVSHTQTQGRVVLERGLTDLTADASGLTVRIESETAKDLIHARFVIDSHLVTFAHREGFTGLVWTLTDA